jgi:hypothetical protein
MPCPAIELGLIPLFIAFALRHFTGNGKTLEAQVRWMARNYVSRVRARHAVPLLKKRRTCATGGVNEG